MIKKIIIALIVVAVTAFGYWTISPFFINKTVNEVLVSESSTPPKINKIAAGSFTGFDKIHNGTGTVSVYEIEGKMILRFEDGFSVNNGPDLYVGFGINGEYVKGSEIAELKGNIGAQNYEIPKDFPIGNYDSVYVWCKAFSTPFIKANLSKII